MGNVYLQLPAPAADGAGAWVDVSAMGFEKTIIVGNLPTAVLHIEMTNEAIAANPAPLAVIANQGTKPVGCAALWMRAKVVGYKGGGAPVVYVAANDDGAVGVDLPAPAVNGVSAGVDVSAFGESRTFTIADDFTGLVTIEGSDDDVNYAPFLSFSNTGRQKSLNFGSKFLRIRRSGVAGGGTPTISMAAIIDVTPGPGFLEPVIFNYTVTGAEPDTSEITIPLPAARADAAYLVLFTGGFMAAQATCNVDAASKTNAQFVASFSGPLTAGDHLTFLVANP